MNLHTSERSPRRWIADLRIDLIQFDQGFGFCYGAHPGVVLDTFTICTHQMSNELQRSLLRVFGEVTIDVRLSQQLARIVVQLVDKIHPARFLFPLTVEQSIEHVETSLDKVTVHIIGHFMEQGNTNLILPDSQRLTDKKLVQRAIVIRLVHEHGVISYFQSIQ